MRNVRLSGMRDAGRQTDQMIADIGCLLTGERLSGSEQAEAADHDGAAAAGATYGGFGEIAVGGSPSHRLPDPLR
jgi:hypothetical protein